MNPAGQNPGEPGDAVLAQWQAAWPRALSAWSKYTRLREPLLCGTSVVAAEQGLDGSFAMIRLLDQSVVIDLERTRQLGLDDHAVEILAHEVGHHVLAPATADDQFRLLARIRRALPTLESQAPMVANLFTDLLINDRLQRQAGLRMADIYRRLQAAQGSGSPASVSGVWTLYMGIYERLWGLDPGGLGGPGGVTQTAGNPAPSWEALQADAWLGARLIRVYSNDWMTAASRFASLLLPYLVNEGGDDPRIDQLQDTRSAASGCEPSGLHEIQADELEGDMHPSQDPLITGTEARAEGPPQASVPTGQGQAREPWDYGEILRAAGLELSDHDCAVRYYRERALCHLVPFPVAPSAQAPEPQPEGLEPWQVGESIDAIDWLQSVVQSPHVVPGLTTVQRVYGRVYGQEPGAECGKMPVDLDLYVDSSGSMPDPQRQTSYLALAGAVIALSALRSGSAVQVTLWSGKQQILHTGGFVRNEDKILRVLTGFFGGATAFPIHRLRETYATRSGISRPVHILMISDDGISTMFDMDEQNNSGWDVAARALACARAGGTMALNLPGLAAASKGLPWLQRAQEQQGWIIHAITRMEDLAAFAQAFSRRHYGAGSRP